MTVTDDLRVHGMGRELVAPDWPPLRLPEVAEVLAGYGLEAQQVRWSSPRPLSAAALVQTDQGTVFVKRHAAAVRTPADLAHEHAFADHLAQQGIPVPAVLADTAGRRAVASQDWTWEVHAQGRGDDVYRDVLSWEPLRSTAHAVATGAMLARIALAAADFAAPGRPTELLVSRLSAVMAPDLVEALTAQVAQQPRLQAALAGRDWQADVTRDLVPWHRLLLPHLASLPSAWTHGDGHASNLLWRGDEVTDVLDLGLSDRTTPLLDLATAIERHCVSWLDPSPAALPDQVDGLLAGWHGVRPFGDGEQDALAALLPLVHVGFALSELAYFHGVTRSADNAELAYDGYLLGHARWFGSPPGTALLDRVRTWRSARP